MGAAPGQIRPAPFPISGAIEETQVVHVRVDILGILEWVQRKAGEASDAGEVLVEGENGGAVLHGDGGDQRVDRGQTYALGTSESKDGRCLTIGGKSGGLEDVPRGEIAL